MGPPAHEVRGTIVPILSNKSRDVRQYFHDSSSDIINHRNIDARVAARLVTREIANLTIFMTQSLLNIKARARYVVLFS